MSNTIRINDRVWLPEHPEYGYGIVKLIEEDILSDDQNCQVSFEWVARLTPAPVSALRRVKPWDGPVEAGEIGPTEELQRRLGAALVIAENSQSSTFTRSFTMPLPHQAFVLEKILSDRRFGHVIADDVGMGKTIEAGLLVAALRQRDRDCRVLILCPAGVVLQWQDEMDEHFGLTFDIAGRDFRTERDSNWDSHPLVLASLDTMKQERLREVLQNGPGFDLVICDEAHRLTARRKFLTGELERTQNYKFIDWLVQERVVTWEESGDGKPRSPRLILMSATPHQGDNLRFAYLLELVRPDLINAEESIEPDGSLSEDVPLQECLTRTAKKRAVNWDGEKIFLGHDTVTLNIPLASDEKTTLERLARYVASEMEFESAQGEALVRALAMHTFQKIAASSWAALRAAFQNRLAKANDVGVVSDDGYEGDNDMGQKFAFVGETTERDAIKEVLESVAAIQSDSKWESFRELLSKKGKFRPEGERVLIFTQYRMTQSWLAARLEELGETVYQIHGGLSLDDRRSQRIGFEEDGTILISTEAGSEGANLHRKCHLMVNYDLPWNPMRLLQRIGRLDRFGQKHRVKVANLKAPESWDSMISDKIDAKLATVEASMGLVADEDYRAMILGGIHDVVKVPDLMKESAGVNDEKVDATLDEAVREVLERRESIEGIFRESLGMPEDYGKDSPALEAEHFRQAFAWAAAAHDVQLRETRTSENKFLKGVYHFTLPPAFRGGLRSSRECYLVFDRERFAEVRNISLGRARGNEIRPTLAGFGDAVTDWFFRSALHAVGSCQRYAIKRSDNAHSEERWWLLFVARWKSDAKWCGPDWMRVIAVDDDGSVVRIISPQDCFLALKNAATPAGPEGCGETPRLDSALENCRETLRESLDVALHGKNLQLQPFGIISLS